MNEAADKCFHCKGFAKENATGYLKCYSKCTSHCEYLFRWNNSRAENSFISEELFITNIGKIHIKHLIKQTIIYDLFEKIPNAFVLREIAKYYKILDIVPENVKKIIKREKDLLILK